MVSKEDPYFLSYQDGTPFFWLGDTGWELIHLLKQDEVRYYLKIRKQQGYDVIQTVAVSEDSGLTKPNAYGKLPFINRNPESPDTRRDGDKDKYNYWSNVDFVINEAEKDGMYIALLPSWGEYVIPREAKSNKIFTNAEQAYSYGNFLATGIK